MILDGRRKTRARATELLGLVGLPDRLEHRPERLSGGEQQRVAIAVALANEPEVVLADEPTGELDSATSPEVFGLLRRINEQLGTTIVIVTHDPRRVRAGPADGRDPRRPDLDRDAPPDRAGRRRRPSRDQRGVRGPRPGRPAAAAQAAHRGARAPGPRPAPPRGRPRRGLARQERREGRLRHGRLRHARPAGATTDDDAAVLVGRLRAARHRPAARRGDRPRPRLPDRGGASSTPCGRSTWRSRRAS